MFVLRFLEIGFVFAPPEGGLIVICLCIIDICVHSRLWEIGFVLHKNRAICRDSSTIVERRPLRGVRNPKSETRNTKQSQNLNDPNSKLCLFLQMELRGLLSGDSKTCGSPLYPAPAGFQRLPSGKHTTILTYYQTIVNKKKCFIST